jgi:hypothetical protein
MQLGQQRVDFAPAQQQPHLTSVQHHAVQAWRHRRPGGPQLRRQHGQTEPVVGPRQVFAAQRMRIDGHVVQPRAALRVAAPDVPQRQEVVAGAEAGLEHDEVRAPAPAFGQAAAGEKKSLLARQCAVGVGVGVGRRVLVVAGGQGVPAFTAPRQARRDDGLGLHRQRVRGKGARSQRPVAGRLACSPFPPASGGAPTPLSAPSPARCASQASSGACTVCRSR